MRKETLWKAVCLSHIILKKKKKNDDDEKDDSGSEKENKSDKEVLEFDKNWKNKYEMNFLCME